uniref:Uncharacterized protein n=1 Tax=Avena sativa TaxID=4498 RepID=A0ACD5W6Z9_AVESA
MGFDFQVMTADIDERSIRREDPEELVMVLAEAKADAIMSRMNISDYQKEDDQPTLLITSDIVVVHERIIREKPSTKEEARQFLKGYSGGNVSTVGGVVVTNLTSGKKLGSLDKAEALPMMFCLPRLHSLPPPASLYINGVWMSRPGRDPRAVMACALSTAMPEGAVTFLEALA